jgi:hypothetical protein
MTGGKSHRNPFPPDGGEGRAQRGVRCRRTPSKACLKKPPHLTLPSPPLGRRGIIGRRSGYETRPKSLL